MADAAAPMKWTAAHWWTAAAITVLGVGAIVARAVWSNVKLDQVSLGFFTIGVLPWLALFFKKVKGAGFEAEVYGVSGRTDEPPPLAPATKTSVPVQPLSTQAMRVLTTLLRYQRQHFGNDTSKRFTFAIFPGVPEYAAFLKGVSELVERGLAFVVRDTNQVALTDTGVAEGRRLVPDLDAATDFYVT